MTDIILSFCIGTYNQADRVFALVNSILTCKRNDIEVAVTDNASTDHTFDLLGSITDTRFHYYRNESNIGGIANWTRSLTHAKGKYAFFSMDRDLVIQENIEKLCDFLHTHDLAFVYCDSTIRKNVIYHDKAKSFLNMYTNYHPTGVIYNTYCLAKIEDLGWFEKEENVGYDPQNFLAGYLCLMGDSARLKNIYWKFPGLKSPPRSFAYGRPVEELFFHPNAKLKYLIQSGNYLIQFGFFSIKDIRQILYKQYVFSSTYAIFQGLRFYSKAPTAAIHYGIKFNKFNNVSLYKEYLSFYIKYKKSNLFSNYSKLYRIRFLFHAIWMLIRLYIYPVLHPVYVYIHKQIY